MKVVVRIPTDGSKPEMFRYDEPNPVPPIIDPPDPDEPKDAGPPKPKPNPPKPS